MHTSLPLLLLQGIYTVPLPDLGKEESNCGSYLGRAELHFLIWFLELEGAAGMEEGFKDESLDVAEEEEQESIESNQNEKSKIGIMRAFVEREDPSSKVVPLHLHLYSSSSLIDIALLQPMLDSIRLLKLPQFCTHSCWLSLTPDSIRWKMQ